MQQQGPRLVAPPVQRLPLAVLSGRAGDDAQRPEVHLRGARAVSASAPAMGSPRARGTPARGRAWLRKAPSADSV